MKKCLEVNLLIQDINMKMAKYKFQFKKSYDMNWFIP